MHGTDGMHFRSKCKNVPIPLKNCLPFVQKYTEKNVCLKHTTEPGIYFTSKNHTFKSNKLRQTNNIFKSKKNLFDRISMIKYVWFKKNLHEYRGWNFTSLQTTRLTFKISFLRYLFICEKITQFEKYFNITWNYEKYLIYLDIKN